MCDLSSDLHLLIGKYGYGAVLQELDRNMRSTYEFLRIYYGDLSGNQMNSPEVSGDNTGKKKNTRNRKVKASQPSDSAHVLKTENLDISGNSSGDQKPQNPSSSETPVEVSGDQKKIVISGTGIPGTKGSGVKISVIHSVDEKVPQPEENVMISGEENEQKEKKVWPFVKSENINSEKKGDTPREILKNEILKRKEELNSSGLKKNAVMTKENLERLISEGLGYTEMGRRLGRMPNTVKEACVKYGLQPLRGVRKIIPDTLKKYLDDDNCRKEKLSENREIASKLLGNIDNSEWINDTTLCIYGVFRKTDKACVYIGATEDFTKRVENHKKSYDGDGKHKLYEIMKENGGFENHIYIPLEKPENEIGLSFRESLWWESLKPLGNAINPFFTV